MDFRDTHNKQLVSFREKVASLTQELRGSATASGKESEALIKEIRGEAETLAHELAEIDDRLFVAAIQTAAFAAPSLAAMALPGVPLAALIALGCVSIGAIFGVVLKDIGELWSKSRKVGRNGVSYLLDLQKRMS